MKTQQQVLKFSGARKSFGDVVALAGFDLEVAKGELVTLLGPSGCGKTTALRIAAGFEQPDSGTVELHGANITNQPAHKRNMGMVFQNYSLFPHMNVTENVGFGLKVRGKESAEREMLVTAAIDRVRLNGLGERYSHQLSGGQQQRVALARALVFEPQVLLLDEPLSALDAKVRAELRDEIRLLQSEVGVATIFVTHDQDEALSISDRICIMKDGHVQQIGTPRDVYLHPANAFVARFVGAMNEIEINVSASSIASIGELQLDLQVSHIAGPSAKMLLRPDAVSICQRGDQNSLNATVVGQHFSGATTMVRLRLDHNDTDVSALLVSRAVNVVVGEGVGVLLNTHEAIIERSND
jgi:putative spermidine/putrescine transport system ATP-binding protein